MQEEDLSEKGLFVASIMSRVRNLKSKYKNEENITDELNKVSADTTDNSGTVNRIMMTANNPEDWLNFLFKLEKKGSPQTDTNLLNRLIGRYSQAVAALSAEKYSQNESYAHIMVRFAELKAIEEPEEARDQFHLAKLNCKKFAFVHVAFAQFELSQGNVKKAKQLLEKAAESKAVPLEMLAIALRNLALRKKRLISSEVKENFPDPNFHNIVGTFLNGKKTAGSVEITTDAPSLCPKEKSGSSQESEMMLGESVPSKPSAKSNQMCTFGRVPIRLISETDDSDVSAELDIPRDPKRQISNTKITDLPLHESKPDGTNPHPLEDLERLPNKCLAELQLSDEENSELDTNSTLTLKAKYDFACSNKRKGVKEREDTGGNIETNCLENERQQHFISKKKGQNEGFRINHIPPGNNWYQHEVRHKRYSEEKSSSSENPAFPVSKESSEPKPAVQKSSPLETTTNRNRSSYVGTTPSNSAMHNYMAR